MNGHILHGTNIAVDYWKIQGRGDSLVHFLTHLHGDHIIGLTSSWHKPIYCSEFTSQLLTSRHGLPGSLLRICELNRSMLVSGPGSSSFTVIAIDANHCPGALMFYFQGDFGKILYTGDFRASPKLMDSCKHLATHIDTLYLDNTFCSPKCVFPSRGECLSMIVSIIQRHPQHHVLIGVRKLGKESLLAQLGVRLNETVCVSPECYHISQMLFATDVFTTTSLGGNCRIRTVPMHTISRNQLHKLNNTQPTIAIIPTAIYTGLDCQPFVRDANIFVIPYSDHCNYGELMEFVSSLRPARVLPIVRQLRGPFGLDISDRGDMACFQHLLSTGRPGKHMDYHSRQLSVRMLCETTPEPHSESMFLSQTFVEGSINPRHNLTTQCVGRLEHISHPCKRSHVKSCARGRKRSVTGVVYSSSLTDDSLSDYCPIGDPTQHSHTTGSVRVSHPTQQNSCLTNSDVTPHPTQHSCLTNSNVTSHPTQLTCLTNSDVTPHPTQQNSCLTNSDVTPHPTQQTSCLTNSDVTPHPTQNSCLTISDVTSHPTQLTCLTNSDVTPHPTQHSCLTNSDVTPHPTQQNSCLTNSDVTPHPTQQNSCLTNSDVTSHPTQHSCLTNSDVTSHPTQLTCLTNSDVTPHPTQQNSCLTNSDVTPHPTQQNSCLTNSDVTPHPTQHSCLTNSDVTSHPTQLTCLTNSDVTPHPTQQNSYLTNSDVTPHPTQQNSCLTNSDVTSHPTQQTSCLTNSDVTSHPTQQTSCLTNSDVISHPTQQTSCLTNSDVTSHPTQHSCLTNSDVTSHPTQQHSCLTNSDVTSHPTQHSCLTNSDVTSHPTQQQSCLTNSDVTSHPTQYTCLTNSDVLAGCAVYDSVMMDQAVMSGQSARIDQSLPATVGAHQGQELSMIGRRHVAKHPVYSQDRAGAKISNLTSPQTTTINHGAKISNLTSPQTATINHGAKISNLTSPQTTAINHGAKISNLTSPQTTTINHGAKISNLTSPQTTAINHGAKISNLTSPQTATINHGAKISNLTSPQTATINHGAKISTLTSPQTAAIDHGSGLTCKQSSSDTLREKRRLFESKNSGVGSVSRFIVSLREFLSKS